MLLSRSILAAAGAPAARHRARRRRATSRVRVPVTGTDETGQLAGSFNQMMRGPAGARAPARGVRRVRRPAGGRPRPGRGPDARGRGGRGDGPVPRHPRLHGVRRALERARGRRPPQRRSSAASSRCSTRHGGHANKFVGDGLLGVFGAPDRLRRPRRPRGRRRAGDRRAGRASATATSCGSASASNSGPVVAGTVGGGGRVEFTVIGDAVNTAARVEEVTRETGDDVLITEATRCLLAGDVGGSSRAADGRAQGQDRARPLWAPALPRPSRRASRRRATPLSPQGFRAWRPTQTEQTGRQLSRRPADRPAAEGARRHQALHAVAAATCSRSTTAAARRASTSSTSATSRRRRSPPRAGPRSRASRAWRR